MEFIYRSKGRLPEGDKILLAIKASIKNAARDLGEELVQYAKDFSFQTRTRGRTRNPNVGPGSLRRMTGELRKSIRSDVSDRHVRILAGDNNVKYAAIHEKGGQTFAYGNKNRPVTLPARPYLQPAVDNNLALISDIFVKHFMEQWRRL